MMLMTFAVKRAEIMAMKQAELVRARLMLIEEIDVSALKATLLKNV